MKNFIVIAACVVTLVACNKPASTEPKVDDPSAKNVETTTNVPAAATAAPREPVTITETDLATPADFEESAEKAITAKTYKAELALLESNVAKE